jgi:hypothetical protein
VALVSVLAAASPARAAEPVVGLRSLAMGNSLRAAAVGAEGILLNPSGIALLHQYAVTGFYGFNVQSLGHAFHVSVADSVTQRRIAMGLAYTFVRETPRLALRVSEGPGKRTLAFQDLPITRNAHEISLVTAIPLGDRFILGVTTKYGYFSTNVQLPADGLPADFMPDNPSFDKDHVYDLRSVGNVVSFDIGLTVRVLDQLSLGVVGQNLWPHGNEQPSLLGAGLAYGATQRLTLAADVLVNFNGYQECVAAAPDPCRETANRTTVRAGGGMEYAIVDRVPLRLGYMYDSAPDGHHISAGLGYFTARYGIDVAMRQRLSGGLETLLVLGFRLFRD